MRKGKGNRKEDSIMRKGKGEIFKHIVDFIWMKLLLKDVLLFPRGNITITKTGNFLYIYIYSFYRRWQTYESCQVFTVYHDWMYLTKNKPNMQDDACGYRHLHVIQHWLYCSIEFISQPLVTRLERSVLPHRNYGFNWRRCSLISSFSIRMFRVVVGR